MVNQIIINPASAGGKTSRLEADIVSAVKNSFGDCSVYSTSKPGDATDFLSNSGLGAGDRVLVVGGDGTINEVVNGLMPLGSDASTRPSFGVIPSGSGGDFRRTFDWPDSIVENVKRFTSGATQLIDVGLVTNASGDKKYFCNVASTGLSAQIGVNVNRSKILKKISGELAFNWTILTSALTHKQYPLKITTSSDPEGVVWSANCVAVCNGQYFGSGVRVGGKADPGDGVLNFVVVHDLSAFGFLKGVSQIKLDDSSLPKGMTQLQGAWIEIEPQDDRSVPIETDGEYGGDLPARFEVVPSALRLL